MIKPHLKWDGEFWMVTNWLYCDEEKYDIADAFCEEMAMKNILPYNIRDAQ